MIRHMVGKIVLKLHVYASLSLNELKHYSLSVF